MNTHVVYVSSVRLSCEVVMIYIFGICTTIINWVSYAFIVCYLYALGLFY